MKELSQAATNKFSWRVPAIDGVRALAMLMVYTYHMWQFGGSPKKEFHLFGQTFNALGMFPTFPAGVDLFMVLSGFCLFLPLCKSEQSIRNWDIKQYFVRRVRRIAPPYYAAMLYVVLVPQLLVILYRLMGQKASWQDIPSAWQVFTHLFFIHSLFVSTWDGLNSSFWSLGLEAQFYAVFPLVVFGFRRYGWRFFGAMIAVSILYRIAVPFVLPNADVWPQKFVYSIFFLGRWMQFALGAAAAYTVSNYWKSQTWRPASWGTLVIVGAVATYAIATTRVVTRIPAFPMRDLLLGLCFSALIVALCTSTTPLRKIFENKAMVWLGFISYSFFLIHEPTAWYISEFLKKKVHVTGMPVFLFLCSVGFLVVLGASYLFFLAFERPFLNTTRKDTSPSRTTPSAAPETAAIQDQAML